MSARPMMNETPDIDLDDEAVPVAAAEDGDCEVVIARHPMADRSENLRVVEAMLFAAAQPLRLEDFREFLPGGTDVAALLSDLTENYANRGVNITMVAGRYVLRTAPDMGTLLRREKTEQKRLSKAALETLAIVAYHQPVTRAEIEEVRGVAISKGTLDNLLEIGWVKMRGRRKTPGRPVTYGTTESFLSHFGLNELTDLPGLQELKAAGLLDGQLPPGFDVPMPRLGEGLTADEEPLDGTEALPLEMPLEMHLDEPQGAEAPRSADDE